MVKAPIGRLTTDTTSTVEEIHRIRRLLARADLPTSTPSEAAAARTVAYRLTCEGLRRGVIDFADIADLLPTGMFDYQGPERH
jgi:hypothetical protein